MSLHDSKSWDKFPQCKAILWYAKGLGAARIGTIDLANEALTRLQQLRISLLGMKQPYWVDLVDMEDEICKSPVTPGHVLPARAASRRI